MPLKVPHWIEKLFNPIVIFVSILEVILLFTGIFCFVVGITVMSKAEIWYRPISEQSGNVLIDFIKKRNILFDFSYVRKYLIITSLRLSFQITCNFVPFLGYITVIFGITICISNLAGLISLNTQNFTVLFYCGIVSLCQSIVLIYFLVGFRNKMMQYINIGMKELYKRFDVTSCQMCFNRTNHMNLTLRDNHFTNIITLVMMHQECCGINSYLDILVESKIKTVPFFCCKSLVKETVSECLRGNKLAIYPGCLNKALKYVMSVSYVNILISSVIPLLLILMLLALFNLSISLYVIFDPNTPVNGEKEEEETETNVVNEDYQLERINDPKKNPVKNLEKENVQDAIFVSKLMKLESLETINSESTDTSATES